MASIFDVDQNALIENVAAELKKIPDMKAPQWSVFCKTGAFKERPPVKPDWWYTRAASILRRIYMSGPIGVSKLRTLYGGKKNKGMAPERFYKGSGSIIRKALQQLEKAGLAKQPEKVEKGRHKGRVITPKGKALMDKAATAIQHSMPRAVEPKTQIPAKKHAKEKKEAKPEEKKEVKKEAKEIVVEKSKKPRKEGEAIAEKEKKPKKEQKALKQEMEEVKELTEEVAKKEIKNG